MSLEALEARIRALEDRQLGLQDLPLAQMQDWLTNDEVQQSAQDRLAPRTVRHNSIGVLPTACAAPNANFALSDATISSGNVMDIRLWDTDGINALANDNFWFRTPGFYLAVAHAYFTGLVGTTHTLGVGIDRSDIMASSFPATADYRRFHTMTAHTADDAQIMCTQILHIPAPGMLARPIYYCNSSTGAGVTVLGRAGNGGTRFEVHWLGHAGNVGGQ